jgi:hypothetical protein
MCRNGLKGVGNIQTLVNSIEKMRHNTLENYVITGLNSSLIKGVRLFEQTTIQSDEITPHSHRFNFSCLVLCGMVINELWVRTDDRHDIEVNQSVLTYLGSAGKYQQSSIKETAYYKVITSCFKTGDTYAMRHNEIHSIRFSEGAKVLFFEEPSDITESIILEVGKDFEVTDKMFINTTTRGNNND